MKTSIIIQFLLISLIIPGCADDSQLAIMRPKVLVIIYNPIIESEAGTRLCELFNWNDADSLARIYIADLKEASNGLLDYQIVKRIEADEFPVKKDGFRYTDESFMKAWRTREGFHQPDAVDYNAILNQYNIIPQIESGAIDEVWLFGFPYGGFWESTMAGKGAFYCNSDPIPNTENCSRKFIVMGFNYERGVGCMLEDFGHRTESIMSHVFRSFPNQDNLWKKFILHDKIAPGKANCGNVHYAPNSDIDYDWGNKQMVVSNCDDWHNFPNFKGISKMVNCEEWGNGDIREYHKWWLKHIPKVTGEYHGVSNNWWRYMVDPNNVSP